MCPTILRNANLSPELTTQNVSPEVRDENSRSKSIHYLHAFLGAFSRIGHPNPPSQHIMVARNYVVVVNAPGYVNMPPAGKYVYKGCSRGTSRRRRELECKENE